MFATHASNLEGCFELSSKIFDDARGRFVKTFHTTGFEKLGLASEFREEYYSVSHKNVVRGLHFQMPPVDHVKLVYCVQGSVMDAVVDLRLNSPTYGQFALFDLSAQKANSIYIPKGMAHGFYTTSEQAILVYKVSTVYTPEHDAGILWNSAGIPWPVNDAILSERDRLLVPLDQFRSPFRVA